MRGRGLSFERRLQVGRNMGTFHSEAIKASIVHRAHFARVNGFHGTEPEPSQGQKTIYVTGGRIKHRQPIESQP